MPLGHIMIRWIAVLAVAVSQTTWAIPVPGSDTVVVNGRAWAQVDLFTGNSWNEINAQCPSGVCSTSSKLNGWGLEGWTWASIDAVQLLLNSFTGGTGTAPSRLTGAGTAWAPAFLQEFRPTNSFADVLIVRGASATIIDGLAFYPFVRYDSACCDSAGDIASTDFAEGELDLRPLSGGAWFYRDVPAPTTLALFGLGLASIWTSRRKNRAAGV